jgi:hypothetical protein
MKKVLVPFFIGVFTLVSCGKSIRFTRKLKKIQNMHIVSSERMSNKYYKVKETEKVVKKEKEHADFDIQLNFRSDQESD